MKDLDFIPDDYEAPESTYDTFPDGKYKVHAFQWFSIDDNQKPILAYQKDGKLVGRLRFIQTDGKDGPPMSLTLGDMALFAKAVGIKVSNPPPPNQAGMVTQFMLELQEKFHKEIEVECKGGWVNSVPGMDVPSGYFYFHIADVTGDNSSGQVKPRTGQYGQFFFVTFEVDAGEGGSETPYKGAQFTELVNFGMQMTEGHLDWERTKPKDGNLGVWNSAGVRMSKLVRLSAPDIRLSELTLDTFLAAWRKQALESKRVLKGSRMKEETGPRIRLVWSTLEEASGYKRIIEEMGVDDLMRKELVHVLDSIAQAKSTVGETYELTDAGKEVARKYLSPLKKSGQIKHGSLEELTPDEIITIMRHLFDEGQVNQEELNKIIGLGIGIQETPEEEETPF